MSDQPENKPATGGRSFSNYITLDLLLGMAIGFGRAFSGASSPNDALISAAISLTACVAIPLFFGVLRRYTFKRTIQNILLSMYAGALTTGMLLFIVGTVVWSWHASVPTLRDFAEKDFAVIDTTGSGIITYAQLDSVLKQQAEVRRQIGKLQQALETVSQSPGSHEARDTGVAAIRTLVGELEQQRLPDDQLQRMSLVQERMYPAGHISPHATGTDVRSYQLTRDELVAFQRKLETSYPVWNWGLRTFGLLP